MIFRLVRTSSAMVRPGSDRSAAGRSSGVKIKQAGKQRGRPADLVGLGRNRERRVHLLQVRGDHLTHHGPGVRRWCVPPRQG
jgi:hypothetical protein